MNVELTVLLINTVLLVVLGYIFNKSQKKNEAVLNEIADLNAKVHDNLVLAEQDIKAGRHFGNKLEIALLRCGSRLEKYDGSILIDVYRFMNDWTISLGLNKEGVLPDGELSKIRADDLAIMKEIRKKTDKLFNST